MVVSTDLAANAVSKKFLKIKGNPTRASTQRYVSPLFSFCTLHKVHEKMKSWKVQYVKVENGRRRSMANYCMKRPRKQMDFRESGGSLMYDLRN